ncbi:hypothetical protein HK102_001659 [Quaeritorhiza haematococci]|nr:hypothetical protein HK102_001659 [Quaeritorhiza haematococci]
MTTQPCGKCSKLVYPTEKVEAGGKFYHKGCFKCSDTACGITLTLKTLQVVDGNIWCNKHAPKPQATQISDDVSVQHAKNVPKKSTEGLHKVQVGTGDKASYGLDNLATQHALSSPKKPIEGLHKTQVGTGEAPKIGLDSMATQHAMNVPKKSAEGLAKTNVGTGETPNYGLDSLATQHAMNSPRKPTENLGFVQKGAMGSNPSLVPRSSQSASGSLQNLQDGGNSGSQTDLPEEITA